MTRQYIGSRRDPFALGVTKEFLKMPYATIGDLPGPVQRHLPEHAQEIYRSAFNHAWESYATDPSREEIAHRVAWAAVKRRYRKIGAEWVPLDDMAS